MSPNPPLSLRALCALAPVIPVLTVADAAQAEGLARALVAGGLPVLEVTLRTPAALDAIAAMARVEGAHVGAGTVLSAEDAARAARAGARFAFAPGLTEALSAGCRDAGLPLVPGVASASEAMRAAELGHDMLKFFPASAAGGPDVLRALAAPLPHLRFCPTGGITAASAPDWLALDNVACVGGSWIAPAAEVARGDWAAIEARARAAAALPRPERRA